MKALNFDFEKNKNLIIVSALVVIFIFDVIILMKPQIAILSKLSSKSAALNRDLRDAKKAVASQKDTENKLALLKVKVKEWGSAVTPEEELPSVLEGISRIANQTSTKITQIKPIKEEKAPILKSASGTYYKIPILIEAQCGYHSLGKFLNELENGQVIMKIIALEIVANPADIMHHLVKLTVQTFVIGK